ASRLAQFAQTSPTRVQVVSASLLSTLSASRINEVRFGYSRYRTSFSTEDAQFNPQTLGFDFGTGQLSLPEIDFGGVYDNLGATGYSIPRGRTSQSFQILDNFTWVRGRHTVKFGGEYRRIIVGSFNTGPRSLAARAAAIARSRAARRSTAAMKRLQQWQISTWEILTARWRIMETRNARLTTMA